MLKRLHWRALTKVLAIALVSRTIVRTVESLSRDVLCLLQIAGRNIARDLHVLRV